MSNRKPSQAIDPGHNFSAFREELLGEPATGRLEPFPGEPRLLDYLLIAALLLAPIPIFVWLRERRLGARTRELRSVLDHADALEQELQECRTRLREIPALVSHLPPAISLSAHATLTAEPEVQAALHDLLQHRLWLRQFGADASLAELKAASAALVHSREKLALQLNRLDDVRKELASAVIDIEDPAP
jgi:chaperonin cofactor prefoldin